MPIPPSCLIKPATILYPFPENPQYYKKSIMIKRSRVWLIFIAMSMCWIGSTVKGSQDKDFRKEQLVTPFSSYTETIPGSAVSFEMIAVPGGQFVMGSPQDEPGRKEDEGPIHTVDIDPFWMGKHEITWEEFELFVYPEMSKETTDRLASAKVDGVTQPTPPFVDMS